MKLAFSTNAFRKYSIEEAIDIVADAGYDGIELMCDRPHAWPPDMIPGRVDAIRSALDRRKLGLSNLNGFMMCAVGDFHHPSWIDADSARRHARRQHTIDCVKLASTLGATTVSTQPGGLLEGRDRAAAMKAFQHEIHLAAHEADGCGIDLLVEPEPDCLLATTADYDDFLKGVVSPAIGMNCDLGHFYCVGEDPAAVIRKLGPDLKHVHLEDIAADRRHFHLPPGQGALDFPAIFKALRDVRYDGWVTVELYPFLDDAPKICRDAREFLKRWIT